jgi:hypothetical protein
MMMVEMDMKGRDDHGQVSVLDGVEHLGDIPVVMVIHQVDRRHRFFVSDSPILPNKGVPHKIANRLRPVRISLPPDEPVECPDEPGFHGDAETG